VTCSAGNHGRAVAYVAKQLGLRAVVFVSQFVPANKIRAIQELGAEVVIAARGYDEAAHLAELYGIEHGMTYIPAFDDVRVVAGQGTIALEIIEALPDVTTIVVPIGGGGLVSGIAVAAKAINADVRIAGATTEHDSGMLESVKAGHVVEVEDVESLADALVGGIGQDNKVTFALVRRLVDEITGISEEQISDAIAFALRRERLVVEGSGACAIALLRTLRAGDLAGPIVAVVSGDNIDVDTLLDIAGRRSDD
jgi:threonine dehydratase